MRFLFRLLCELMATLGTCISAAPHSLRACRNDCLLGEMPSGMTGRSSAVSENGDRLCCCLFLLCSLTVGARSIWCALGPTGTGFRRGLVGSGAAVEATVPLSPGCWPSSCCLSLLRNSGVASSGGHSAFSTFRGEGVKTSEMTYDLGSVGGSSIDVNKRTPAPWLPVPAGVESSTSS